MKFSYIKNQPHLDGIEIVHKMVAMYDEYISPENKYKSEENNYLYKYTIRKADPVSKFTEFVYDRKPDLVTSDATVRDELVKYHTNYFYMIKGTREVLNYMSKVFGFTYTSEPVYTGSDIEFVINSSSISWVNDEGAFLDLLSDFLKALLYISNDNVLNNISTYGFTSVNIPIDNIIEIKYENGIHVYKKVIAQYNNNES